MEQRLNFPISIQWLSILSYDSLSLQTNILFLPKNSYKYHLSSPSCHYKSVWNTNLKKKIVHTLKVNGVQNKIGTYWLSLCGQNKKKHPFFKICSIDIYGWDLGVNLPLKVMIKLCTVFREIWYPLRHFQLLIFICDCIADALQIMRLKVYSEQKPLMWLLLSKT